MVNIEFSPYKNVVVKSYFQEDLDSFIYDISSGVEDGEKGFVGYLNWANGIIFYHQSFPSSEIVHQERIKGTLYIELLVFAEMDKYVKEIPLSKDGQVKIAVTDATNHTLLGPLAKWMAEKLTHS